MCGQIRHFGYWQSIFWFDIQLCVPSHRCSGTQNDPNPLTLDCDNLEMAVYDSIAMSPTTGEVKVGSAYACVQAHNKINEYFYMLYHW